jgi:2-dehydropantoate 2-reductase
VIDVLIYGAGAVGLGIASCLLRSGAKVDVVGRPDTVNALRTEGLTRTGIFGDVHFAPDSFGAFALLRDVPQRAYDFILVCTKSFDSPDAARDLAAHQALAGKHTRLVLCQNGWGNAEQFCEHFDRGKVFNARVITGFHRPRPNEVEVTVHADAIHVGSLFTKDVTGAEALCRAIDTGGIPCEVTSDIGKDLWAKMLYNCALNPLGAILRVPYGALGAHPATRDLMNGIADEVFHVMEVSGYETHWSTSAAFLKTFYDRLIPDTAEHRSSMLQDMTAGKPTEIEALTGAVIRLAGQHDLDVPHNRAIYDLVKFAQTAEVCR